MSWFNTRILNLFLGLSLLMQAPLVFPQAAKKTSSPAKSTAWLSKPMEWTPYTARLFADEKKITFMLVTSWIPGEKHQGMLRYRMSAFPERSGEVETTNAADGKAASSEEKLLRRGKAPLIGDLDVLENVDAAGIARLSDLGTWGNLLSVEFRR